MNDQRILIIVGPTASGKSGLAIMLAKHYGGEVISADSRQVYKGLDLGTGKVTTREMDGVRHHLLDVVSPKRTYTANDYVIAARKAIADVRSRGKLPIICGGTGFYIDALLGRVNMPEVPPDPKLRSSLREKSVEQLFSILEEKDPARARSMNESDRRNPVRLVRAIEIASSNKPRTSEQKPLAYEALWIGIKPSEKWLKERITSRLVERLKRGMLAEAKRLHAGGLSYKRMESLGLEYRYEARLLQKQINRTEFEQELGREIWHYARRQMTYLKRNTHIQWFASASTRGIERAVRRFLKDGLSPSQTSSRPSLTEGSLRRIEGGR